MNQSTEQPTTCPTCGFIYGSDTGHFCPGPDKESISWSKQNVEQSPTPTDVPGVDLERLKELRSKATPGPLTVYHDRTQNDCIHIGKPDEASVADFYSFTFEQDLANAEFLAALHNSLPALLYLAQQSTTAQSELEKLKGAQLESDRVYAQTQTAHSLWKKEKAALQEELDKANMLLTKELKKVTEASFTNFDLKNALTQSQERVRELEGKLEELQRTYQCVYCQQTERALSLRDAEVERLRDGLDWALVVLKRIDSAWEESVGYQVAKAALAPAAQEEEVKAPYYTADGRPLQYHEVSGGAGGCGAVPNAEGGVA